MNNNSEAVLESDNESVPLAVLKKAEAVRYNLAPKISRSKYEAAYQRFTAWRSGKH